ncbi:MAG: hypothetical protein Q8M54_06145 [Desulfobaccales bacterium]|nr:hypothetical protein [Desulfobaccales bacterium]
MMNYAMYTVYYGYYYRRAYEKQLSKEGDITTHYALIDPSDLACFLALSALSGIIGNLAYDLIKKAFLTIIKKSETLGKEIGQSNISISSEGDMNIFIQYIEEFHLDADNISPRIKQGIFNEIVSWEVTDIAMKSKPINKEELAEIYKQAIINVKRIDKPLSQDFINFWKQLKENVPK